MGSNKNKNNKLHNAKSKKNDEFYTQLNDINSELRNYRSHFKDKVVFCNCDDPEWSNFWKYFTLNFDFLGMKKLVATHYVEDGQSYKLEFLPGDKPSFLPSDTFRKTPLQGNGDFRSDECVEILKEADIVVTNPPFSLFREYVAQLMEHEKSFIILGTLNAVTYKEIFQHIQKNELWLGPSITSGDREFKVPTDLSSEYDSSKSSVRISESGEVYVKVMGVRWFTNLSHPKRNEELILYKEYCGNEEEFPKYDNYDAINVDKTKDIPIDYDGVMGVPISFLDKYCPDQFEIVGLGNGRECFTPNKNYSNPIQVKNGKEVNGNAINRVLTIKLNSQPAGTFYRADGIDFLIAPYARILIRRRISS